MCSLVWVLLSNLQLKKGELRKKEARWKKNNGNAVEMIKYFYRYSDYSMQAIAEHLSMPLSKVKKIVDELGTIPVVTRSAFIFTMFVRHSTKRRDPIN